MGDEVCKILMEHHTVLAEGYKYLGGSAIFSWY